MIRGASQAVTLGSVSGWNGSQNIVKDPPKSITTRRIDKVGDTQDAFLQADDSDRFCESIQVYPRGVNPFVSVSYSNNGTNGGQNGQIVGGGVMASNPFKIMKDGAFRWDQLTGEQLAAISRQARTIAYNGSKSQVNFSKSRPSVRPVEKTREVHNEILHARARPTQVYNIHRPHEKPYDVKYFVQEPLKVKAYSGTHTVGNTSQYVGAPTKGASNEFPNVYASTNISGITIEDVNRDINTTQYIADAPHTNVTYLPKPSTNLVDGQINRDVKLNKEVTIISANSGVSKIGENVTGSRTAREQLRSLPRHSAYTNVKQQGGHTDHVEYKRLPAGLSVGSFNRQTGTAPMITRLNELQSLDTKKSDLLKRSDFRATQYASSPSGMATALLQQKNSSANSYMR